MVIGERLLNTESGRSTIQSILALLKMQSTQCLITTGSLVEHLLAFIRCKMAYL